MTCTAYCPASNCAKTNQPADLLGIAYEQNLFWHQSFVLPILVSYVLFNTFYIMFLDDLLPISFFLCFIPPGSFSFLLRGAQKTTHTHTQHTQHTQG